RCIVIGGAPSGAATMPAAVITAVDRRSPAEATHGADNQLQAAGWTERAGIPRGARGRPWARRGGDPGVVGADRPDQGSSRSHGRRWLLGAGAGSLPRKGHGRGERGRAPDDEP